MPTIIDADNKIDISLYQQCLQEVKNIIPHVTEFIFSLPSGTLLADYAKTFYTRTEPLQDGGDLLFFVRKETERLFGADLAEAMEKELEDRFAALTANHHGMDFHPEFFQGNIVFSFGCRRVIPLFSWGGVPGDNASFARGMLLSPRSGFTFAPYRIPLFSNKDRRIFITQKNAYTEKDIRPFGQICSEYALSEREVKTIQRVVSDIFLNNAVLCRKSFQDQMSAANYLLWEMLFEKEKYLPLLTIELQTLAAKLIATDLKDTSSLVYRIIAEKELTQAVYRELDNARACWSLNNGLVEKGSFLFWAADENKQHRKLSYSPAEHALVCAENPKLFFPLRTDVITEALRNKKLLPALYLSFASVAMARGLNCAGGIFQFDYLPTMAAKTAKALASCGEPAAASKISACSPLSTGFLPLQVRADFSREKTNACAADMLLSGGMTGEILDKIRSTDTQSAFLSALAYHYEDLIPKEKHIPFWYKIFDKNFR